LFALALSFGSGFRRRTALDELEKRNLHGSRRRRKRIGDAARDRLGFGLRLHLELRLSLNLRVMRLNVGRSLLLDLDMEVGPFGAEGRELRFGSFVLSEESFRSFSEERKRYILY
jgi:hypothetical protein